MKINPFLEKATAARKQENWSLVNQYLQQLSLDKTSQFQQAIDVAIAVLKQGDFQHRWDVAQLFPKFGEVAITPVIKILENEEADLEQRWFAGRILGEFNHPEAIASLVHLLQTAEDEDLSAIAATALANLGTSAIEVLTHSLKHPQSRLLATRALAQIRRHEVIEPLLTVVKDSNVEVRTTTIEALSSCHDPRIRPVLIAALKDVAAPVRKEAVIGLGLRTDLDILNHLQPRLYDFNLEVCQQAAIAVGRLKTDEAAAALFDVLQSAATPVALQVYLVQALGWMETPASLQYLEQSWLQVAEESILEIIRVLGRIATASLKPKAAEILLNFFHSGHPALETTVIKQALACAWGQLGEASATRALTQLSQDSQVHVKLQALAALKPFSISSR